MFAISLVFYFMGFTSVLGYMADNHETQFGSLFMPLACEEGTDCDTNDNALLNLIITSVSIGALGIVIALFTGYSAVYLVPILLLIAILNLVVFPISFIFDPSMSEFIKIPLVMFFNVMTILAIVNFIRGAT
jgi:hypothetical protein